MFVSKRKVRHLERELDELVFLLDMTTAILNDMKKQEAKKRHPSTPKKAVAKKAPAKKAVK